jgi:hypothetical protein
MARARLLKPTFFTDEAVASCSPLARILFSGLWCLADKRGRLKDQPPVIGGAVLPFDSADIGALISELCGAGLVIRYQAKGSKYLQVKNFEKHQHPHPKEPESEIPGPTESAMEIPEQLPERPEVAVAVSSESFPSLTYPSESESAPPSGESKPLESTQTTYAVVVVYQHWQAVMSKPKAKLTPERKRKVMARIKEGYTVDDLKAAVDGCKASAWHQGANADGKVFDDLELICRDGKRVEQFIAAAASPGPRSQNAVVIAGYRTIAEEQGQ